MLAHVRDPGNAGTVIRAADAAGADAVVLTTDSVDPYNGKCVRATAGSLFHLPIALGRDAPYTIAALRAPGLTVLAADGAGDLDLDEAIDSGLLAGPDSVDLRQRGVGAAAGDAWAGRPHRPSPDLRPGRVAQPRHGGGGLPVRVGARTAPRATIVGVTPVMSSSAVVRRFSMPAGSSLPR